MKKMKQILALMLAVLMLVPALAACKQNTDETENEAAITATPVNYSKSGNYTTTITSDKIKLSGLTAENVEVRYTNPYANVYTYVSSEETQAASEKNLTIEEALPCKATISSVVANANGGYDVVFVDKDAKDYVTSRYYMVLKNYNV